MSSIALPVPPRAGPFAACFGLACAAVIAALLAQHWANTGRTLLDTDDAMRLVQMRDWLAGQGWFDLRQSRIALAYESHWSRLIDAPLAVLYLGFQQFAGPAQAERLTRAVWPLIWIVPAIGAMCAIAWRCGGRPAALAALLIAVAAVPGYQQFMPGRIDHHNVQLALTLMVVAATIWCERRGWYAAAAGALSGLSLAIGFETLPYLALCGAAFALRFVFDRDGAGALRAYSIALAIAAGAFFFVSVGPQHWLRNLCDALAFNSAAAVVAGGAVLIGAAQIAPQSRALRLGAVVLAAGAAAAVIVMTEPRCLAGPYALVDPAIRPIWLGHVRENQPLARVVIENPLTAAGLFAFPAFAALVVPALLPDKRRRIDFAFLVAAAVFLLATATTVGVIRAYSFAIWLGMPLVAVAAVQLRQSLGLRNAVARTLVVLFMTPLAVSSLAIAAVAAAGLEDTKSFARPERRHCFDSASYRTLAALPPGLVLADVSYGPFILALTPHTVVSAPYHRLSEGIVVAHRAFALAAQQARAEIEERGVAYIVLCGPQAPDGLDGAAEAASLWRALQDGARFDWLEPVGGDAFKIFRVRSPRASQGTPPAR